MKKLSIIVGAIFFLILVVLGLYGFSRSAPTISIDDPNRPIAIISESSFDFGQLNIKDVGEHDFVVTNNGQTDLLLKQFSTSCDCTSVSVIKDGEESPRFSMTANDWKTKLSPGKNAKVRAIYTPAAMPVKGNVSRTISFSTNDPARPYIELTLTAEVVK